MKLKEKQVALNQYRALLMAILDYLLKLNGGMIVCDGDDIMTEIYTLKKIKAEKYYQQRRLDRLRQILSRNMCVIRNMDYSGFENYLKATTNYDLTFFESLIEKRADVASENKIMSTRSHLISHEIKDGIEEIKMMAYTGPKLKQYSEQEMLSPDGKRRLMVTSKSAGKYSSTTVSLHFPKAYGEIYRVDTICPDIIAFWKNNHTIIIENRKEYIAYPQYKQLRSFDDVVDIEYLAIP